MLMILPGKILQDRIRILRSYFKNLTQRMTCNDKDEY